jgi:hypothetical protein
VSDWNRKKKTLKKQIYWFKRNSEWKNRVTTNKTFSGHIIVQLLKAKKKKKPLKLA